jgi:hypothetical protein
MKINVFKKTKDNWCGNYKIIDNREVFDLVEVSFMQLLSGEWRVCVWGNDDFGVERDFKDQTAAFVVFQAIIQEEYVNKNTLLTCGFEQC